METKTLFQLKFLSDLEAGPGGQPIFVVTEIEDGEVPAYRSRLALFDGELRWLTQGEARAPRFFQDRIYFMRKVDDRPQLFVLPLRGGEPEQLTRFSGGVLGYTLGPGGELIYWTRAQDPKAGTPRTYSSWPFKFDGRGLLSEAPVEVYVNGEKRLERFPGPTSVAFGADGALYFVAAEDPREGAFWRETLYRHQGSRTEKLWGGVGPIQNLVAGPEGLAFLAHAFEHGGGTEPRLYFLPYGESEPRALFSGALGNSINSDVRYGNYAQGPRFGADGRIYLLRTEEGQAHLYAISLEGKAERIGPDKSAVAFALDGRAALVEDFVHPPRLWIDSQEVFDPNAGVLPELPPPTPTTWQSPEGHRVPGWVWLPEGEGPHPLVLYIHGGPHTAFGQAMMFELALFRAAGYAVAFANPRGSTGYGQAFALLEGRWGEIDEADLMGFLDHVLENFPIDRNRVGVAGGSYGGFMTNWLIARHPDRFKAAVTDRSIANWTSFFGASDIGIRFTLLEIGASPWERPERLWEKSPLRLAHRVKAPTLVVHSEADHRCPIDQGETWYTALFYHGVKARFFRVPEEGHELSRSGRPDRRLARLEAYLEWWWENL